MTKPCLLQAFPIPVPRRRRTFVGYSPTVEPAQPHVAILPPLPVASLLQPVPATQPTPGTLGHYLARDGLQQPPQQQPIALSGIPIPHKRLAALQVHACAYERACAVVCMGTFLTLYNPA